LIALVWQDRDEELSRLEHVHKNEIRKDVAAAQKISVPWWAAVCVGVSTFFLAMLFDSWGQLNFVSPVLNTVIVVCFVLAVKWEQGRKSWFWVATALMLILHAVLLFSVRWTASRIPAIGIIDSLDICLMLALFEVVRSLWRSSSP
jgi:MFS superfamily sulfate permease-like transporter